MVIEVGPFVHYDNWMIQTEVPVPAVLNNRPKLIRPLRSRIPVITDSSLEIYHSESEAKEHILKPIKNLNFRYFLELSSFMST